MGMTAEKPKTLSLLIVDDHEIVRIGLRTVLNLVSGMQVVGECATGAEAVSEATRLKPDIVLLDIRLSDRSGVEVCRDILAECPGTHVLFLTSYADDETILSAVISGAQGYVLKDATTSVLIEALRTIGAGQSLLDPKITTQALSILRARYSGETPAKPYALSPQEERVLKLVADGKTNKEIAAAMGLSDKTVKNYLANVYDKLHVSRRSQATAVYLRSSK
jgi:two-component system, NarL family, response regulator DevR